MAHAKTPAEPAAVEEKLELSVHTLSGNAATVSTSAAELPLTVAETIEHLIGIPAASQQWLMDSKEIVFQQVLTMADTGLQSGSQITVMHCGFNSLVSLPEVFHLELSSMRHHIRTGYSSAFTVLYKITGSVQENYLYFEPWRKNDHDKILFDMAGQTMTKEDSHWMCGTNKKTWPLAGNEHHLSDMCQAWAAPARRVAQDERFWLDENAEVHSKSQEDDDDQERPSYSQGLFRVPEVDGSEIITNIPLPESNKRIVRLLLDKQGNPKRAAVKGCKRGGLHQDLEDFVIALKALEKDSKPKFGPQ